MSADRDEDFLNRWSRRKVESRRGLKKKPLPAPDHSRQRVGGTASAVERVDLAASDDPGLSAQPPDAEREERSERDDPDLAAKFEGFDFDALDYESDYTQFMEKGVPDAIRRRALRSLWQSNPILANLDGLNDYDEDFTDAALAVEVLQTAYKVGRGYLTDEDLEGDEAEESPAAEEEEVADLEADKPVAGGLEERRPDEDRPQVHGDGSGEAEPAGGNEST